MRLGRSGARRPAWPERLRRLDPAGRGPLVQANREAARQRNRTVVSIRSNVAANASSGLSCSRGPRRAAWNRRPRRRPGEEGDPAAVRSTPRLDRRRVRASQENHRGTLRGCSRQWSRPSVSRSAANGDLGHLGEFGAVLGLTLKVLEIVLRRSPGVELPGRYSSTGTRNLTALGAPDAAGPWLHWASEVVAVDGL
jgi:hypothetical protein